MNPLKGGSKPKQKTGRSPLSKRNQTAPDMNRPTTHTLKQDAKMDFGYRTTIILKQSKITSFDGDEGVVFGRTYTMKNGDVFKKWTPIEAVVAQTQEGDYLTYELIQEAKNDGTVSYKAGAFFLPGPLRVQFKPYVLVEIAKSIHASGRMAAEVIANMVESKHWTDADSFSVKNYKKYFEEIANTHADWFKDRLLNEDFGEDKDHLVGETMSEELKKSVKPE